jgi:hypothetical protein
LRDLPNRKKMEDDRCSDYLSRKTYMSIVEQGDTASRYYGQLLPGGPAQGTDQTNHSING